MRQIISYAQNYEDVILWRALKHVKNGFYIDVGAYHPVEHSVTAVFYENGWAGINIEPVEDYFQIINAQRPRDINLNCGITDKEGNATLYLAKGTGLSTLNEDIKSEVLESKFDYTKVQIDVCTLNSVLEKYSTGEIHFLKIDVEGEEKKVLAGTDLNKYRPWIIVIEANIPLSQTQNYKEWEKYLLNSNYKFVYYDGLNRFYVTKEKEKELASNLRLPPNVFDDFIHIRESELWNDIRSREHDMLELRKGLLNLISQIKERKELLEHSNYPPIDITEEGARGEMQILLNYFNHLLSAGQHLLNENQGLQTLHNQFNQITTLIEQGKQQQYSIERFIQVFQEETRLRERLDILHEEKEQSKIEIERVTTDFSELKSQLESAKQSNKRLKQKFKSVKKKLKQTKYKIEKALVSKEQMQKALQSATHKEKLEEREIFQLKEENNDLYEQTIAQDKQIFLLNRELDKISEQLDIKETSLIHVKTCQQHTAIQKHHLSLRVQALENSLSWKITAPIRWLLKKPMQLVQKDKLAKEEILVTEHSRGKEVLTTSNKKNISIPPIILSQSVLKEQSSNGQEKYGNILDFVPQEALDEYIEG